MLSNTQNYSKSSGKTSKPSSAVQQDAPVQPVAKSPEILQEKPAETEIQ
jgi:hypothetical protein